MPKQRTTTPDDDDQGASLKPSDYEHNPNAATLAQELARFREVQEEIRGMPDRPADVGAKVGFTIPREIYKAVKKLSALASGHKIARNKIALHLLGVGLARWMALDDFHACRLAQEAYDDLDVPQPALEPEEWAYRIGLGAKISVTISSLTDAELAHIFTISQAMNFPSHGGASIVVAEAWLMALDTIPLPRALAYRLRGECDVFLAKLTARAAGERARLVKIQAAQEAYESEPQRPGLVPRRWGRGVTEVPGEKR